MKKLLLPAAALAVVLSAPVALAGPNDRPRHHDTDNNDRPDNDKPDRANNNLTGPDAQGPGMSGNGPDNHDNRSGNANNNDRNRDNDNARDNRDRNNDNDRARNDRNDRPDRVVVKKKVVDRTTVLKFRANIRAPHRYRFPRPYVRPVGWYPHRWVFGERLPRAFFVADFFILDFAAFGLIAPWDGYEWVRYGNDALLIDLTTGEVIRVEYDIFY